MGDLVPLLDELRRVGQKPERALLDRVKAYGQDAVRPLIEMAVDEGLHDADSDNPAVWAPLHAIQLLGELGAPEAVEPLLSLFDRVDDDWLAQTLPEAFGGIGAPAVAPLRALLFDREKDVWARVRAADSLSKVGQRYPERRADVVSALVARLDPLESQTPEDEILNGFVISVLLDLEAVEAAPAIRRTFAEDRVDTSVVDLDDALETLGLPAEAGSTRAADRKGLRLRVRCTACGYEREHFVETVYIDLGARERRQKGKTTPYDEIVIPQRLTCRKCGAVDQYELAADTYIAIMAEMLKKLAAHKAGMPGAGPEEGALRLIRFGLTDGRQMHPLAARDMYRKKVEAEPNRADLRVRYANVLRFLNHREEAIEQYRAALRQEPSNLEAYLNLGRFARAAGDLTEAHRMFESVLTHAPTSGLPRKTRESYVEMATEDLAELDGPRQRSGAPQRPAPLAQREDPGSRGPTVAGVAQPIRVGRKVGRNEPCPCGSGKKYKKCHGR